MVHAFRNIKFELLKCTPAHIQAPASFCCISKERVYIQVYIVHITIAQENLERFPFPNEEKEFSLPSSMLDESKVNTGEAEGTIMFGNV